MPAAEASLATPAPAGWWQQLHDPAIDALVEAALADSPSIAQALARVEEARALRGATAAGRVPAVALNGTATRARALDTDSATGQTQLSTQSTLGLSLSWELDPFGRVRHSVQAADQRLAARQADAQAAELALVSQISDAVLASRACTLSYVALGQEIQSRETTLGLTQRRQEAGFTAPVDQAQARSGLAMALTSYAQREETCVRPLNALVALTGQPRATVRQLLPATADSPLAAQIAAIPPPPPVQLALPAAVLAAHPSVVAADREVAAAWEEIAVARAERLPRLDLGATLSGQWLRAAGQSLSPTVWSVGPSLSGPLLDGGRGKANVSAAQARYDGAAARLEQAVRTAAQEVENALAAIDSATQRSESTVAAVEAAQQVMEATLARWRAGAVSLFEVEDARRQLSQAQAEAIAAAHDRGRAWVALMRASGHALGSTSGAAA